MRQVGTTGPGDHDDYIDSAKEAKDLQKAIEYEKEREKRLEEALRDRENIGRMLGRYERWMNEIRGFFHKVASATQDLVTSHEDERKETKRLRQQLERAIQRLDVATAAPIETSTPTGQVQIEPKGTVERIIALVTGPDGKRTPWSFGFGLVLWQILEALLRHGVSLGDFIQHSPSP